MNKSDYIFGYIYRIFNPKIIHVKDDGQQIQPCYVGKTEDTIHKRFLGHKRDVKKFSGSNNGGDGKLHAEMWAKNSVGFKIEELAVASSPEELSLKEAEYIKKFDSIKNGWNKITASTSKTKRGQKVTVIVDGKTCHYESNAHLCRQLNISGSSLTHWLKKGLSISDAVKNSIDGKAKDKLKKNKVLEVFKRKYSSFNEIARDERINKHKLAAITIRNRIKNGMSLEEAVSTPKEKGIETLTIKFQNNKSMTFNSIAEAHKTLTELELTKVAYQTVVSYLNKGQTPEQAFGLSARPWEMKYKKCDELVKVKGYEYVGEKNRFSEPVIVDYEKKIYPSIKLFAETYGIDYTTVAERIKTGMTIEEILKKSGHL